jgi:hypothetical protein
VYGILPIFSEYFGRKLVVTDRGYWQENAYLRPAHQRHYRIAINGPQPDVRIRLFEHPRDRFDALGLEVEPVSSRGDYVLVCGHSPEVAQYYGLRYGEWEADTVRRLRKITQRPIVVREKPPCEPLRIEGVERDRSRNIGDAIRSAWSVVCKTGNVGADAILHGVPVFAESGPGRLYHREPLERIDSVQPLNGAQRIAALSDLAYWQYTPEEFSSGVLWDHLRKEVL